MATNTEPQSITTPTTPKPKRWVARHKILTGVGVFLVVGVIASATGAGSKPKTPAAVSSAPQPSTKAAAPASTSRVPATVAAPVAAAAAHPGQYWSGGDWGLSKPVITEDALGEFDISATATYFGVDPKGGSTCIEILVSQGATQLTTGTGCPDSLLPGHSARVNFSTFDNFVAGPYSLQIQKSF